MRGLLLRRYPHELLLFGMCLLLPLGRKSYLTRLRHGHRHAAELVNGSARGSLNHYELHAVTCAIQLRTHLWQVHRTVLRGERGEAMLRAIHREIANRRETNLTLV